MGGFDYDDNLSNKMHLYLKKGLDKQRWLIVQLVEGHAPCVVGLSSDETHTLTDNIEPAIWFKVMVVESVTIDCSNRHVQWTTGITDKVNSTMFGGDSSCYDFDDDIDELFDLSDYLIDKNPLAEPNENLRKERIYEYELKLFRLMHCYILSKIILQPRDIECVKNASKGHNKSISLLEDNMLLHSRLAEHYMSQLRNIREVEIFPILELLVDENRIGKDLLQMLVYDLRKAEPAIRKEIDKSQKKVDELKELLRRGATYRSIAHDLADARRARDVTHRSLVQHLVSKELTQVALSAAQYDKADKMELNDACRKYMSLYKRVQEEKRLANSFVVKKVRAVSVRECIQAVIKDLEKGRETSGEEMTSGGQRITDVIDANSTEWQTMSQRISSLVHNPNHPIGQKFADFYQTLELSYRKALRTIENVTYGSARFMTSFDDFYVISEQDLGLNKLFIEDQRNIILRHLYIMTEILIEHFNNHSYMFIRKVRLCYEKCFFNRLGRDLILIYRVVYGKSMQTLEQKITRLKEVQIDNLGLEMKSEWWLQLFETDYEAENCISENENEIEESRSEYGEFGDDEDITDYDDDEYCTDTDEKNEIFNKFKKGLHASKVKVLSRSVDNLCNSGLDREDWVGMNTRLLKEDITQSVKIERPRFDSRSISRYLEDESTDNDTDIEASPKKGYGGLRKANSTSLLEVESKRIPPAIVIEPTKNLRKSKDSFEVHFGKALESIKHIFSNSSPLKKMQCLTTALRLVANKVEELRMRGKDMSVIDRSKLSVTAEDLLPLLVLVLLKLQAHDVAKLYTELIFIADLMAEFLSSGCHSYALCEFQIAFRVLDQTCEELSI